MRVYEDAQGNMCVADVDRIDIMSTKDIVVPDVENESLVESVDIDLPEYLFVPENCLPTGGGSVIVSRETILDIYRKLSYATSIDTALELSGVSVEIFYNVMRWSVSHVESAWHVVYKLFERGMNRPIEVCLESILKAGKKNWQPAAWIMQNVYGMNGKMKRKRITGDVESADLLETGSADELRKELHDKLMGRVRVRDNVTAIEGER